MFIFCKRGNGSKTFFSMKIPTGAHLQCGGKANDRKGVDDSRFTVLILNFCDGCK